MDLSPACIIASGMSLIFWSMLLYWSKDFFHECFVAFRSSNLYLSKSASL